MGLFSRNPFRRQKEEAVTVAVTRDSVAMGDDIDAPHEQTFSFPEATPVIEAIGQIVAAPYLAYVGSSATWSVASNFPLAVWAQSWPVPRPFPDRNFVLSTLKNENHVVALHFTYHQQRDPEVVYAEIAQANQKQAEEAGKTMIETWRHIIVDGKKSYVLFAHGTCVVLPKPEGNLAAQATRILKEAGPVQVGSPSADFSTLALSDHPGWIVTGHHPDVLNYISPDEVEGTETGDLIVGLLGRAKRDADSADLHVVHIEDARGAG